MRGVYGKRNIKAVAHCVENRIENGKLRTTSYLIEYAKNYGIICPPLCTTNGNFEFFVQFLFSWLCDQYSADYKMMDAHIYRHVEIDGKVFDNACEEIKEALFFACERAGKEPTEKNADTAFLL